MATAPSVSRDDGSTDGRVAFLVDFDNFFRDVKLDLDSAWLGHELNEMVNLAISVEPDLTDVRIRLYGGWLDGGLLTNRASELQAAASVANPFPVVERRRRRIIRGDVVLVTRLAAMPEIVWAHTFRTQLGFPRVRVSNSPTPDGCIGMPNTCPIRTVRHFVRRKSSVCPAAGCHVRNEDAFEVREQKMVDSLICCDALAFALGLGPKAHVIVMSDDLDVVPAVTLAASCGNVQVDLVRSVRARTNLYETELADVGVGNHQWRAS